MKKPHWYGTNRSDYVKMRLSARSHLNPTITFEAAKGIRENILERHSFSWRPISEHNEMLYGGSSS
jgi:hypothetical protein